MFRGPEVAPYSRCLSPVLRPLFIRPGVLEEKLVGKRGNKGTGLDCSLYAPTCISGLLAAHDHVIPYRIGPQEWGFRGSPELVINLPKGPESYRIMIIGLISVRPLLEARCP